ncbi:alpha/beta fold hydrolase [Profundibacter amoris]|uniref:Alpha/beta hydrolase n=1 Tax=Profundibacter amoris TaxID=2171755 RepID=A0A347UIX4_9RHOB|nr:alpha/beta hydrolase [Profundibacter amoris]AXX98802.1 alpha/beta hydrolase [Profundibacter amoris]
MVYMQHWGRGDQRALLLHCSLASSDAWRGVAGHLADDLSMSGIDFPGHGRSRDWDRQGDYHAVCRDAAVGALEEPVHLIGHSLGATVALRLAVERPELVRALVLIEPVFFAAAKGLDAYAVFEEAVAPFAEAIEAGRNEDAARMFTDLWGTGAAWQDLPAALRQSFVDRIGLIPATEGALYHDNAGVVADGKIEAITCPVLLIEGDQSPAIINAINGALAERLPDATRVSIKGAGHMVPITHAKEVAQAIGGFLNL